MTQTRGKQLIIHVEFGQQSLLQKGNYSFQEKGYTNLLYKGILGGDGGNSRRDECEKKNIFCSNDIYGWF